MSVEGKRGSSGSCHTAFKRFSVRSICFLSHFKQMGCPFARQGVSAPQNAAFEHKTSLPANGWKRSPAYAATALGIECAYKYTSRYPPGYRKHVRNTDAKTLRIGPKAIA
jgi:hypothetical protein